jgi:predicted AlkP superfamily phosphohydrolase/phosphomutase
MSRPDKVLMIAFDAAEPLLVDKLMAAGRMPNLAGLKQSGGYLPLKSTANWFVASPWPSFYSSSHPVEHGLSHYLFWDPASMSQRRPSSSTFQATPFWRHFDENVRAIAIDVPMLLPPSDGNQLELSGWSTHDTLVGSWAYPSAFASRLKQRSQQPKVLVEKYQPLNLDDITDVGQLLRASTRKIQDIAASSLASEPWDFALINFTAPHMAGHQLWSPTSLLFPDDPRVHDLQKRTLDSVYADCDEALGRLLDCVTEETLILVFSLHGMEPNSNRGNLLDTMLELILADDLPAQTGYRRSPLSKLRSSVPLAFRQAVKRRLPKVIQDRLTAFWRTEGVDWKRTEAFAGIPDLQGFVRINLRGRESLGIVEPGKEYDELCTRISDGLAEFIDADTREPIVREVRRASSFHTPVDGPARVPDLIVNWSKSPCAEHREIVSRFGNITWPTPGINFDGRSGNHSNRGFLISNDPALHPGHYEATILDLAPTVCDYLGVSGPDGMRGRSLYGHR